MLVMICEGNFLVKRFDFRLIYLRFVEFESEGGMFLISLFD